MDFRVDTHSTVPPSRQLVEAVLDAIASGRMAAGERLPSIRSLAASVLVNPNTVSKAYRDLEVLEVVEARNGSGVFVTGQGPDVARELRLAATLHEFVRTAEHAMRAGHAGRVLESVLARIVGGNGNGRKTND